MNYVADVILKSGYIGAAAILLQFVCLGVFIERVLFWGRLWGVSSVFGLLGQKRSIRRFEEVETSLGAGDFTDAAHVARRSSHPIVRVFAEAFDKVSQATAWESVRDHVLAEHFGCNITLGRQFLVMSIQGFGLLGMLGTCKGLFDQLSGFQVSGAGMEAMKQAAEGMGEAFTTTLIGLAAAGFTTLLYMPNEWLIDRFKRQVFIFDNRVKAALSESKGVTDSSELTVTSRSTSNAA